MSRILRIAGAQMGANQKADSRKAILDRMIALLEDAAGKGAQLVVFPELPFTTFFPRWLIESTQELDTYFERDLPGPQTQPLFDRARELGVGMYVGYAELTPQGRRYNSSVTTGPDGAILGKYRKIHLPGTVEPRVGDRFQQLELFVSELLRRVDDVDPEAVILGRDGHDREVVFPGRFIDVGHALGLFLGGKGIPD